MITYEEYKENGGTLGEAEFNVLLPIVANMFNLYIMDVIPRWRIKPLNEYGMNLTLAFVEQIDFIELNGGINVVKGRSDYNIRSVSTGGISMSLSSRNIEMHRGVPFAPFTMSSLVNEMRRAGLLSRLL